MSERYIQVFSDGDPLLLPYLAQYLQARTCNLLENGGAFYLRSSYFEQIPVLFSSAKRKQAGKGMNAVLDLISPSFATLPTLSKREICIQALLFILNGALKLKYRNCGGLTRFKSVTPEIVEHGSDFEVNGVGQEVYTRTRSIPFRVVITAGIPYFRAADRKQPSLKKIWNIARNNASVARALYYYVRSEALGDIRSTIEELMKDTYMGTIPPHAHGKVPFNSWKSWVAPEVSINKLEEFYAILHNPLLAGGDQAVHSMAFADIGQATQFKSAGTNMSLQEVRDILHTLLMKWVTMKV